MIVLNHQHSIDILFLFEIWPELKRATALSKKALMYAGPFGICAYLVGTIFIDRSRGVEAREKLVETVKEVSQIIVIQPCNVYGVAVLTFSFLFCIGSCSIPHCGRRRILEATSCINNIVPAKNAQNSVPRKCLLV